MLTPLRNRHRGATLIEVIVAIAILALLTTFAAGEFLLWIQNTQIRTVSEAVKEGIASARSEAIKRNEQVQINFDADYKGWRIVRTSDQTVIRTENGLSDFPSIVITPDLAGSTSITFSSLGRALQTNSDNSVPFGSLQVDNTKMDPGDSRELQIRITTAGSVRMCDPNKAFPSPVAC